MGHGAALDWHENDSGMAQAELLATLGFRLMGATGAMMKLPPALCIHSGKRQTSLVVTGPAPAPLAFVGVTTSIRNILANSWRLLLSAPSVALFGTAKVCRHALFVVGAQVAPLKMIPNPLDSAVP